MKIMGVLPVILSKAFNVEQCNEVLLYKLCFRREHEILMKVLRGDELTNNGSSELWIGLSESIVCARPSVEIIWALCIKAGKSDFKVILVSLLNIDSSI